jgi:cytochrome o ubiquinol oxidase subunit 2
MAGMTTRLSLQADRPGTYQGLSAQFSGDGFSDMRFDLVAVPADRYAAWVAEARAAKDPLDAPGYAALARSGTASPMAYRSVTPHLFETIAGGSH